MRHPFLTAAVALSLHTVSFASNDAPSVSVAYADLNLNTPIGRERLERRLAAAVKRVCPSADVRDLVGQQVSRACIAGTNASLERAVKLAVRSQGVALASVDGDAVPAAR